MSLKETSLELDSKLDEDKLYKIFGKQKVKLYKIKHFIFDFGGVMVEKTYTLKNLYQIIEEDLGINIFKIAKDDAFLKKIRRSLTYGKISAREFLQKIFEKYYYPNQEKNGDLPPKKVDTDYYLELWFQLYSLLTNLPSEMEEIIVRLHQAGYIVSLMSNTFDIHAKSNELKGFYNLFDHVFLSNEIGYKKPDLEKYKYVLNKLDTKPEKCIFIDDKIKNLVPARELGMLVIKFEFIDKFKRQLGQIGINEISKNLRYEIKKKHKNFKTTKKDYKKAKKDYKKAKKEYNKKHRSSLKKKTKFQRTKAEYKKKKKEYKEEKQVVKEELTKKFSTL
jgi:epoxide hydrolase-like predicted phosphatase